MKTGEAELGVLASRLRARVAEGRYWEARGALWEYCQALREAAAALPRGDPGLRRLEDEWRGLAEQTRRQVLVGRAHAGVRLARLAQTATRPSYYSEVLQPRRTLECLA